MNTVLRKYKTFKYILIPLVLFFVLFRLNGTYAYRAISETKKVGWGSINTFSGKSYSETYFMVDTGGQIGVDIYTSENHKIMAGFGYFYSLIPFSFTIDSPTSFDFESLTPNTPQMAYTDLLVSSGAAHGYVVTVAQTQQLERVGVPGHYISDTLGDNNDVTHTQEGMWELGTTHGFGYRLNNVEGTDAVFTSGYRQFANLSEGDLPQTIMQNLGVTRASAIRLYYKINIGSEQEAGYYQNSIRYRCTGTF